MYEYRFTFLCSEEERTNLAKLATHHHRSQSDVIRMLLREAIEKMTKDSGAKAVEKGGSHHEQHSA
jgi:Arc/MetJ-type ribon-helix-helix transcriptional regulator